MITVKAFQTHPEYGEYHFLLIDDDDPAATLTDAIDHAEEISEQTYNTHTDALVRGILRAELLTRMTYPSEKEFECYHLDDDDTVTTELCSKHLAFRDIQGEQKRVDTDPVTIVAWFAQYEQDGGLLQRAVCVPLLELFSDFVSDAVCGEPRDRAMLFEADQRDVPYRQVAFDQWTAFMKRLGHPRAEAKKIWQAVDTVTALT